MMIPRHNGSKVLMIPVEMGKQYIACGSVMVQLPPFTLGKEVVFQDVQGNADFAYIMRRAGGGFMYLNVFVRPQFSCEQC